MSRPQCARALATLSLCVALASQVHPARAVTPDQLVEMVKQGESPAALIARIDAEGSVFELSVEEIIRLRAEGLPAEVLNHMLMRTPNAPGPGGGGGQASEAEPGFQGEGGLRQGPLDVAQLVELLGEGVSDEDLVAEVFRRKQRYVLSDADRARLRGAGASDALIRYLDATPKKFGAAAQPESRPGGTARPAALRIRSKLDVRRALERGVSETDLVGAIQHTGRLEPLSPLDVLELQEHGASSKVIRAMHVAAARPSSRGRRGASECREAAESPLGRGFVESGRLVVAGGIELRSVSAGIAEDSGRGTVLTIAPELGVFATQGLYLGAVVRLDLIDADAKQVVLTPSYYVTLDERGNAAFFLRGNLGFASTEGAKGPLFGIGAGLAFAVGNQSGGFIRLGVDHTWTKLKFDDFNIDQRSLRVGTTLGLYL